MVYPVIKPIIAPTRFETVHIRLTLITGATVVFDCGTTRLFDPERLWAIVEGSKNYSKVDRIDVYVLKDRPDNSIILHQWSNPNAL